MSDFIPFFQEEELIDQELFEQAGLEMKYHDKHLVRSLSFPKHHLRKAINICQKDIAAGIFCLLTESHTQFSIWREESFERLKVDVEVTPKLQPQLNTSQLSHPEETKISSQIAGFEMVYVPSSTAIDDNDLAIAFQTLEATVSPIEVAPIETESHAEVLQHQSALAASTTKTPTKTPKSKTETLDSDIYSTPRSAFLALINQELAQHIGPIADYLINKLLAEQPHIQPQKMIEAIVAEISDPRESNNIQKSLDRLTHEFIARV